MLSATLKLHSSSDANKFLEEVFWRTYFKGWLEQRPSVWLAYCDRVSVLVNELESDARLAQRYDAAITGRTGIDCFDTWVTELLETGYLHNHARMWFASIWVFTLELPWELGADFFFRHLLDGDPASNTLSWRWVSGLHTPGKTYLARASNIRDFTNNRFDPAGELADSAKALHETVIHPLQTIPDNEISPVDRAYGLLITEDDCFTEGLGLGAAPRSIITAVATQARSPLTVSLSVRQFALGAVTDALTRAEKHFRVKGDQAMSDDWGPILEEWARANGFDIIVTAFVPVGPVADRVATARTYLGERGIELRQVRREYDSVTWPHASKGFFKLKARIPDLLSQLRIGGNDEFIGLAAG